MRRDPYASPIFQQDAYSDEDEQPHAEYPFEDVPAGVDLSTLCRACSNGVGDGLCHYHRTKLDHAFARQMKIEATRK